MRSLRIFSLLATILLNACTTVVSTPVLPPVPEQKIGYFENDFRVCDEPLCPARTQKTRHTQSSITVRQLPDVRPTAMAIGKQPHVLFEHKESKLSQQGKQALHSLLDTAKSAKQIDIVGYTDDVGTKEFNMRLALERAKTVRAWLKTNGVTAVINVEGKGLCCYRNTGTTPEARQANRRVEFRFN